MKPIELTLRNCRKQERCVQAKDWQMRIRFLKWGGRQFLKTYISVSLKSTMVRFTTELQMIHQGTDHVDDHHFLLRKGYQANQWG